MPFEFPKFAEYFNFFKKKFSICHHILGNYEIQYFTITNYQGPVCSTWAPPLLNLLVNSKVDVARLLYVLKKIQAGQFSQQTKKVNGSWGSEISVKYSDEVTFRTLEKKKKRLTTGLNVLKILILKIDKW